MLLTNDNTNTTLSSLFANQKTNLSATKPLSGIERKTTDADSLENARFVMSNENNLSAIERVKKNIIEQVLNKFIGNAPQQQGEQSSNFLFPSVQYDTQNVQQEQNNPYNQQNMTKTPYGFLYESSQEYYQKTTIDFSASATINTPNGSYNIEINFSYTQEIYEKHSTAIRFHQDELQNNPMEVNLAGDDYGIKDLKHINLLFDVKKAEQQEEENERNQSLLKFLQSILDKQALQAKEEDKALQNKFLNEVAVYERVDENFELAAQTHNGVGLFFSQQKSEAAYMTASYDKDGNFSFSAGYSSYESSTFAVSV